MTHRQNATAASKAPLMAMQGCGRIVAQNFAVSPHHVHMLKSRSPGRHEREIEAVVGHDHMVCTMRDTGEVIEGARRTPVAGRPTRQGRIQARSAESSGVARPDVADRAEAFRTGRRGAPPEDQAPVCTRTRRARPSPFDDPPRQRLP
ncbi:hypothetical protein [Paracoccus sp. (in: a-proteobacteria)]|uniref:hypothetical protein n=1 Tax=Paracoccus sp. TaxID=267 RepID=UPI0035B29907